MTVTSSGSTNQA